MGDSSPEAWTTWKKLPICGLWRLDPDFSVTRVEEGIICTNGPCWSPDDKTFYVADTFVDEFWALRLRYRLRGRCPTSAFSANTRGETGVPDGSTVDSEGCLWNAELISGDLVRYDPEGNGGTQDRHAGEKHHLGYVRW